MTARARRVVAACAPALLLVLAVGAAAATRRIPQSQLPAMRPMPAGVDSGVSPEGMRVLESIPEPIPSAGRVAASPSQLAAARLADSLRMAAQRADSARVAALRDSLAAAGDSAGADSLAATADTAGVPVPAVVPTLADRAAADATVDSALAAARAAGAAAPGAAPPPAAAKECWGVQVGAPTDAKKAAALREAAQSLLLTPMTIQVEKGRHKVRTDRCLSAAAADSLRRRAVMSGFEGAFRFGGGK